MAVYVAGGMLAGYALSYIPLGLAVRTAWDVVVDALMQPLVAGTLLTLAFTFWALILRPLLSDHFSGEGVLGVPQLDAVEPLSGRKFREGSFARNLKRRGSFDMSYLADVVDAAFLRRHATSYLAVPRTTGPHTASASGLGRTFGKSPGLSALVTPENAPSELGASSSSPFQAHRSASGGGSSAPPPALSAGDSAHSLSRSHLSPSGTGVGGFTSAASSGDSGPSTHNKLRVRLK